MKRFFVLSFLAAAAALGVWYGLRGAGPGQTSSATVTNLLPKETLALLYLPDFKRSRAQWHETDLYKLWSEPAVQDFLRKPLARSHESTDARRKLQEMDALEMRDAFLALIALENEQPSVVAGFRFKGGAGDAEKVVAPWRTRLQHEMPEAKHETITYEGHKIEMLSQNAMTAATLYAGDWFFASNDLAGLKAVLDRVDQRATNKSTTLTMDENFIAAAQRVPTDYAAFGYARVDQYLQKLAAKRPPGTEDGKDISALRQIRSVTAATLFTKGKIRDVLFVAMPKMEGDGELTRDSLTLATTDSFLYLVSVLHLPTHLNLPDKPEWTAGGLPAILGRFIDAGTASGITRADWLAAFGPELGVIGDWPANSRLPAVFTTLAVRDAAKSRHIMEAITAAAPEADGWAQSEKDGVQYFSQPASNPMLPIAPTIGLSPKLLVAGLDAGSVERAIKRGDSPGNSKLADADSFKKAAGWVPTPRQSFTYLDTALLYQRLDAALRPMLVMAAAFVPSVAEAVDLGKLPAAKVITSHLSPLVASQSYSGGGYVVESMGPVSIFQAALAAAFLSGGGVEFLHKQVQARVAESEPTPEPSGVADAVSPSATPVAKP